ncbi:hypothetical protein SDC9_107042 [bioreactor metagenome]|uniref:Uncharacterized protein n=1 Tax=bioreactor metagenome TaxID=1076179 RepID=A0A645BEQ4_9ZZZZ
MAANRTRTNYTERFTLQFEVRNLQVISEVAKIFSLKHMLLLG